MKDQAESLRAQLKKQHGRPAKTFAVVSGKGGVGKSNISVNMAAALAKQGSKVLLFDMDIGMGNIHVLLGLDAPYTISDFIHRGMGLSQILCKGPDNISYISAGNGFNEVIRMEDAAVGKLINEIEWLQYDYDYMIFDMGAGAAASSLQIMLSVDDIFVVTTPEPTAITDAYSMIKYICMQQFDSPLYLICNRAEKEKEGLVTLSRLRFTIKKFLGKEAEILGVVPEDSNVKKAVLRQMPFYLEYPHTSAAKKIDALLQSYITGYDSKRTGGVPLFVRKLRGLWQKNS
ncbi:MinD/ParA family protein [Heyndrickxia acidiproducens]|uniref:MinD/ParA family protein n=1 Tax=Heyndrickxia acidiproducens TaxID=1121084 RepID=UPI000370C4EB|nr:MinD/ParA family protein [Heyndrickxia acidiproducens]